MASSAPTRATPTWKSKARRLRGLGILCRLGKLSGLKAGARHLPAARRQGCEDAKGLGLDDQATATPSRGKIKVKKASYFVRTSVHPSFSFFRQVLGPSTSSAPSPQHSGKAPQSKEERSFNAQKHLNMRFSWTRCCFGPESPRSDSPLSRVSRESCSALFAVWAPVQQGCGLRPRNQPECRPRH